MFLGGAKVPVVRREGEMVVEGVIEGIIGEVIAREEEKEAEVEELRGRMVQLLGLVVQGEEEGRRLRRQVVEMERRIEVEQVEQGRRVGEREEQAAEVVKRLERLGGERQKLLVSG